MGQAVSQVSLVLLVEEVVARAVLAEAAVLRHLVAAPFLDPQLQPLWEEQVRQVAVVV